MTNISKFKSSIIAVLAVITLVCMSLFCFVSCGTNQTTKDLNDPTVSLTQNKDSLIKNSSFDVDTESQDVNKKPIITNVTGWSKSDDNAGGRISKVSSGVIDVTEEGWNALLSNLYDDTEFYDFAKNKFGINTETIKNEIRNEKSDDEYNPTSEEIKNKILEIYKTSFPNPNIPQNAEDKKIYMLNNYLDSAYQGVGTAQKVSASSVSLDKNSIYKITLNVKTSFITGINEDGNYGANIRLVNTVGGISQEPVKVSNIVCSEWTEYTFYIKTDATQTCSVTLVLGLGYGEGNSTLASLFTEGTAFYDNINFQKLENPSAADELIIDLSASTQDVDIVELEYSSKNEINLKTGKKTVYYKMLVKDPLSQTTSIEINTSNISGKKTVSNTSVVASGTFNDEIQSNVYTATLSKTSATISLTNDNFKLDSNSYIYLVFDMKTNLSTLGNSQITVDVFDKLNLVEKKRAAVTTITGEDNFTTYGILIKNNFKDVDNRRFSVDIIVGPTSIAEAKYEYDFASGTIDIKNIKIVSGSLDSEDSLYPFYTLYTKSALTSVALYAGSANDYSESSSTSTTYSFTPAPGSLGEIITGPSNVKGYDGIESNHIYINNSIDAKTESNTRSGNGTVDGYAGIINTEYLSNYESSISGLTSALNHTSEKASQPLMIYNKTANHYGFISNNSNYQTIGADNFAKVSLNVRVVGDAKAYIYLVSTNTEAKDVLTLKDFTVNTLADGSPEIGTEINGESKKLELCIDKNTMESNAIDGWVTVSFYIASGSSPIEFRLEMWNGSRDNNGETSQGFVFFDNVIITTLGAFTEATNCATTFADTANPLAQETKAKLTANGSELIAYKRELTDKEKKFNNEYPDQKVSYESKYIWAKDSTFVYAIYNTINPTEVNPYDNIEDKDEDNSQSCSNVSSETFWLSFSSILLAIVLVMAIIALIIKNIVRKHKANASDAKSHYTVTSRIKTHKANAKAISKETIENDDLDESDNFEETESFNENIEEEIDESSENEKSLDSYVYGDVQDFGDNKDSNK